MISDASRVTLALNLEELAEFESIERDEYGHIGTLRDAIRYLLTHANPDLDHLAALLCGTADATPEPEE